MHAIISLANNHPPAPEQPPQLAGQAGPVQVRRARPGHHHQQHARDKAGATQAKKFADTPFDPVARHRGTDLARHRKAEPTLPARFLPAHMAHEMTAHHTLAPLEDELVFRGARDARGWWKPMRARHNRLTAFAASHRQAAAALAPPGRNHCTPAGRGHARTEPVGPLAAQIGRLIRSLHIYLLCALEVAPRHPGPWRGCAAAELQETMNRFPPPDTLRPDTLHGANSVPLDGMQDQEK